MFVLADICTRVHPHVVDVTAALVHNRWRAEGAAPSNALPRLLCHQAWGAPVSRIRERRIGSCSVSAEKVFCGLEQERADGPTETPQACTTIPSLGRSKPPLSNGFIVNSC